MSADLNELRAHEKQAAANARRNENRRMDRIVNLTMNESALTAFWLLKRAGDGSFFTDSHAAHIPNVLEPLAYFSMNPRGCKIRWCVLEPQNPTAEARQTVARLKKRFPDTKEQSE